MDWISENFKWIFDGIGVYVIGLIIAFIVAIIKFVFNVKEKKTVVMKQKGGAGSTNIQIGSVNAKGDK